MYCQAMHRASIIMALLIAAFGCNDDKKPSGNTPAASATATATASATAATSVAKTDGAPPTVAQLREAKKLLRPFKPWGETYDAVVALIGPHQAVDHDGILVWSAVEGDSCVKLTLEKDAASCNSASARNRSVTSQATLTECCATE